MCDQHSHAASAVDRAEGVRSAIASARLEGVEITAQTQGLFDEYVAGAISGDEVMDRVLALYGPGYPSE